MKRLVLDAAVVASWFEPDGAARHLRADYEDGRLVVLGPTHLRQDLLGAMAGQWVTQPELLGRIGVEVGRLSFSLKDASPAELARWIAGGLPPQRAAYLALAAELDLPLVTDDPALLDAGEARAWRPQEV